MLLLVLASLIDCIFYIHNRCHSRLKGAVHVAGGIAWRITLELALIQSRGKLLYCCIIHEVATQGFTDVVAVELLGWHIELVAHVAPECSHHLIVELALLALEHQLVGKAQTLGGYLARPVGTLLHDVGILDGTAAEHDEQYHEGDERHEQTDPVAEAAEEHLVCLVLFSLAQLDGVDILVLAGEIFRLARCAIALLHLYLERLGLDGLVGILARIIIGELHRWDGIAALVARHGKEIVDHVALYAVGGEAGLVGYLGIILVEILREVDHRLLQQFQVADAAHHYSQGDRFACLHFLFIERGRDIELAHAAREVGWALWQRIHLQGDARSLDILLYFYVAGTAVEERLHRVYVAVLLNHDALEGDGWYLETARHLRVHHVLAPGDALVWSAIHGFCVEGFLLWQRHFLGVESLQVRHLAFQLCEFHLCIYLIGKQDRFLLVHPLLAG